MEYTYTTITSNMVAYPLLLLPLLMPAVNLTSTLLAQVASYTPSTIS